MVIHEMRWRMDSWHLCWLSMWIRWRYLPLREMDINVEMQTLSHTFDAAVQPCFDWLAAPAAQRTAAFTIFHRAVAVLCTRGTITSTFTKRTFARTQMETRT